MTPTQLLIREEILRRLEQGESLRGICRDEGYPNESTVRDWASNETEEGGFGARYARARLKGYQTLGDEIIEVARQSRKGVVRKTLTKQARDMSGNVVGEDIEVTETETDAVDARRLHFDALRWTLAKMLPKVYGDKLAVEASGPNGGPIKTEAVVVTVDPVAASQTYQQFMDPK